ncbi:hypothetical protein BST27_10940 [Mycobacterium intermedium]|uniref:Membrane protein ArfC n=1 Tax=Mycobacterium intermedium TaxID=28445 RepID=A0A1E3S920_MYCIE|nr:hypothetical protein [Mycobacterium intermedium]MCV6967825.1 hypothetical protein [Mycobacterium intermedium]ODQ98646.1 hypothetical protein BHQ20_20860 [Mycobacterium intermedium]OPE50830.1 hypothetical protein BV508_08660 [Mycobacterium intermedium]ORB06591.1 hypothetical protein BST27_10940 [Mycobacterium intermedium]
MAHVHWWLVALSFVLGLTLTLTLMVRPVRPAAAVAATRASEPNLKARSAGPKMATRPGPTRGASRKGLPPKKSAAGKGGKGAPAKKGPPRKGAPGKKGGAAKRVPAGRGPATKKVAGAKVQDTEEPTKRIRVVKVAKDKAAEKPFAPYGPGSARADADGGGPEGWLVKGRSNTRHFYTPDDPMYEDITAQVWFEDEAAAKRAFFTPGAKSARKT